MRSMRVFWGVLLIIVGMMFLLDTAGFWNFKELFRTWWPALLILWGFLILRRRLSPNAPVKHTMTGHEAGTSGGTDGDRLDDNAVFGEVSVKAVSKNFRGGAVSTVFGDVQLDLSEIRCAEGEQTLNLNGVFGDLSVVLPREEEWSVSANTLLGTVRVLDEVSRGFGPNAFRETPGYAAAPRKLRLRVAQVFGDIVVRS